MRRHASLAALVTLLASVDSALAQQRAKTGLQVVIVVDTSESTRPFAAAIEKHVQNWLVHEDGREDSRFEIELALVTYGGKQGVRTVFDFTAEFHEPLEEQLPKVLAEFEGGSEPVGEALLHVLNELSWKRVPRLADRPPGIRGQIELYGNESFDQPGRTPNSPTGSQIVARPAFRGTVRDDDSIQLHTYYCGPKAEGKRLGWHGTPLQPRFYDFKNREFGDLDTTPSSAD